MKPLTLKHLSLVSGGEQCQVVVTTTNDSDPSFQFQSTTSGECESLQHDFDAGLFHKSIQRWEDLGYNVTVEFVRL